MKWNWKEPSPNLDDEKTSQFTAGVNIFWTAAASPFGAPHWLMAEASIEKVTPVAAWSTLPPVPLVSAMRVACTICW